MSTNLLGLVIVVLYGERISSWMRILPGLWIFIIVLVVLLFIDSLIVANVLFGLLGLSDAIVQGSTYGLAGQFHPRFVNAVMAGNGLAGIIISAIQIIILMLIPSETEKARMTLMTQVFFGACIFIILASFAATMLLLRRSPVTKYYLSKSSEERVEYVTGTSVQASDRSSVWQVFQQIKMQAFNAFFTFWITLTVCKLSWW